MRLIRLKLKPLVQQSLMRISSEFRTGDHGFTEDVYALIRLKGNGIPSKERADKLANAVFKKIVVDKVNARILINKRMQILRQFSQLAYFRALTSYGDPIHATRRLLSSFNKLYRKQREAECRTCQYFTACDFGKQYGDATQNIAHVIDPDFNKKVHAQCPCRPEIDSVNQLSTAMKTWREAILKQKEAAKLAGIGNAEELSKEEIEAESDANNLISDDDISENALGETENDSCRLPESDGAAKVERAGTYRGSHTGGEYVKRFETMINDLNKTQMAIFAIGQKFSLGLLRGKKGKFKPTPEPSKDRERQKIKSVSELPQLVPTEHALPSALFNEKLGKKSLSKQQNLAPVQQKRILYLLIDNSGSMKTALFGNRYGMLSRAALACVFSVCIARQVRDEGGILFCRFFAEGAGARLYANQKDDFESMIDMMLYASFNGGSTNIRAAAYAAVEDIKAAAAAQPISKSEIILITDCQDEFHPDAVKKIMGEIPLNVIDVSGTAQKLAYAGSKSLHKIAKQYYRVDPYNVDINKMVELA